MKPLRFEDFGVRMEPDPTGDPVTEDPTEQQDEILDGPVFEEPEPVYVEPLRTPAADDIPEGDAPTDA